MKSAADVCVKLSYTTFTSENCKRFVSNFKQSWLHQEDPDLIVGQAGLGEADKSVQWQTAIRIMYTDLTVQWAMDNFENVAARRGLCYEIPDYADEVGPSRLESGVKVGS